MSAALTGEALAAKVRRREEMLEEYARQMERLQNEIAAAQRSVEEQKSAAEAVGKQNEALREEVAGAKRAVEAARKAEEERRLAARRAKEAAAADATAAMEFDADDRSINDERALLAWVETVPFFQENARSDALRAEICKSLSAVTFEPGATIMKQGDVGDAFYVILRGTVKILVNAELVGALESGQAFGERALSEESDRRTATVVADEKTVCAVRPTFAQTADSLVS